MTPTLLQPLLAYHASRVAQAQARAALVAAVRTMPESELAALKSDASTYPLYVHCRQVRESDYPGEVVALCELVARMRIAEVEP